MGDYSKLIKNGKHRYLEVLETINWFDLRQNDKGQISNHIDQLDDEKFLAFTLSHINFDAESFDDAEGYEVLIRDILNLPSCHNLKYKINEGEDSIQIVLQGQTQYVYTVDKEESFGWFDEELIDFINGVVLAKENIHERFYQIPPCDQMVDYIFVPEPLHEKAIQKGVLPDDEEYFFNT